MDYKELTMDYKELTTYLQTKYGLPERAYFRTPTCKSKSPITRGNEGLYIHHIKETEADNLAQPEIAIEYPWEYQLPENLCYCDFLEHLLLHTHTNIQRCKNAQCFVIDGIITHLIPELNHIYKNNPCYTDSKNMWRNAVKEKIINNYEKYLLILEQWLKQLKDYDLNPDFTAQAFLDFQPPIHRKDYMAYQAALRAIDFYKKPEPKLTIERSDGKQYYSVEEAIDDLGIPKKYKTQFSNQIHMALHRNMKVKGYYWKKI